MKRGISQSVAISAVLILLILGVAIPVVRLGGDAGVRIGGDIIYVLLGIAASIAGILSVRSYGVGSPQGKTLLFITLAIAADALAGLIWAVYEIGFGIISPFPSFADAVWIFFYVFAAIALVYTLMQVRRFIRPRAYVLAAILFVALIVLTHIIIFKGLIADPSYSLLDKGFSTFYPLADVILIVLSFLLFMTLRKGVMGIPWLLFVQGFFVYTIGDLLFSNLHWQGTYLSGGITDITYYVALFCFFYGFIRVRDANRK